MDKQQIIENEKHKFIGIENITREVVDKFSSSRSQTPTECCTAVSEANVQHDGNRRLVARSAAPQEPSVSQQFKHGDNAVLICKDVAYIGQVVERTQNNDFVWDKYFVTPLHAPMLMNADNETDFGKVLRVAG